MSTNSYISRGLLLLLMLAVHEGTVLADEEKSPPRARRAMMPYAQYDYNLASSASDAMGGLIKSSFLERARIRQNEAVSVNWTWTQLAEQRHAYRISVESSTSWKEAHLCVNGEPVAQLIPDEASIEWTFHALPWGRHHVAVVVIDEQGRTGIAERHIRIR